MKIKKIQIFMIALGILAITGVSFSQNMCYANFNIFNNTPDVIYTSMNSTTDSNLGVNYTNLKGWLCPYTLDANVQCNIENTKSYRALFNSFFGGTVTTTLNFTAEYQHGLYTKESPVNSSVVIGGHVYGGWSITGTTTAGEVAGEYAEVTSTNSNGLNLLVQINQSNEEYYPQANAPDEFQLVIS